MTAFVLKVKNKSGQNVIKNLTSQSTIGDLKAQLCTLTDIPVECLRVLHGYPPKELDTTQDEIILGDTKLTAGDTLIVEETKALEKPVPIEKSEATANSNITSTNYQATTSERQGILMKKIVPADNSCLFSSIHFVLNGKEDETGEIAPWLRRVISNTVAGDPETFSEAILGKPNKDYCAWIQDDKSWGGAIELSILSNYYGIEIAVVDTINAIINKFGEDKNYPLRVFLLFDGVHYDPLYMEPFVGDQIQTIFPREDENVLKEAEQLALEAKSSRQFTDVNKFKLKCLVCNVIMEGQVSAQQHAKSTGHSNFGEI